MRTYSTCLSASVLFHLVYYAPGSPMLYQVQDFLFYGWNTHTHIYTYMCITFFPIYLSMNTVCFHISAFFWKILVWTQECRYLLRYWFCLFWIYTKKWVAGTCDTSIFNILRNLHIVFCNDGINLHSHQQCTMIWFFSQPWHLSLSLFFDITHSNIYEVVSHCGFNLHFPDDW